MRTFIIAIVLIVASIDLCAQDAITGRVIDKAGKPIEGTTVVLQSVDSVYVDGTLTDSTGMFRLADAANPFRIVITNIAYKPRIITSSAHAIGDVVMEDGENVLKGVEVKSTRPIVKVENNRLVYDVAHILNTKVVTSAYEVAKEIPGVICTDGKNLNIAGAITTTVIVGGKKSNLDANSLLDYLKSLPAEKVEKVELIYNAPPQLHISGAAINVVLKKSAGYEYSGQVGASWTNAHRNSYGTTGSAFLDTPKWSFYTIYSFNDRNIRQGETTVAKHTVKDKVYDINTDSRGLGETLSHNLYGNIGYKIDKDKTIELTYSGQFQPKENSDAYTVNNMFSDADSRDDGSSHWHDVFLTYTSPMITAGAEYMNYISGSTQNMTYIRKTAAEDAFSYYKDQHVDKAKAYLDMSNQLGSKFTLTYGVSYNYVKNTSFQRNIDLLPDGDNNYETSSSTEEHTANGYVGLRASLFANKLTMDVSLKDEWYKINDYKKNALMPNVSLTYVLTPKNIFQLAYNNIRSYPSFWSLQDYTSYSDEYSVSMGNPELKPIKYNNYQLSYILKSKYVFRITYLKTSDYIMSQGYQDQTKLQQVYKNFNLDYASNFSIMSVIPVSIGKWFSTNLIANVYNERYKCADWFGYSYDRNKWAVMLMGNHTFTISQKPKLSIDMMTFYRTATMNGIWDLGENWSVDAGINYQFANDRMVVKLECSDIFESIYSKIKSRFETQHQDLDMNYYTRTIMLSFTYKFKGYKEKEKKATDTSRFGF